MLLKSLNVNFLRRNLLHLIVSACLYIFVKRRNRDNYMKRVVVVFSGGQDSTTCLIQALDEYDEVYCITFDYGQRHRAEIEIACQLARDLDVKAHKVLNLGVLNEIADSSLTRDTMLVPAHNSNSESNELPNTFVPGRNILFLTLASIYAYQVKANTVIIGVSEVDFSGYPDCRDEFIKTLNTAITLGLHPYDISFKTPLIDLNKAETWALAAYYKQLNKVRDDTLTCYEGIKGSGCGVCSACCLRAEGLEKYEGNKEEVTISMKNKKNLV